MMRQYQPKNGEKKEFHTLLGTTDYNIPMFGYKSAFFIFGFVMAVLLAILGFCQLTAIPSQWPLCIGISLSFGIAIAYSQFFIERKKGFVKGFYITVGQVSFFCAILLYIVFFHNGRI